MPKLPKLSGGKTIKVLNKLGFTFSRQKGSHVILKKKVDSGEIGCVVPMHKELADGTLRGILKQAKITPEEFINSL